MTTCPCGAAAARARCCGRYIDGGASAPTAEALMRSRYTAYAVGDVEYLWRTHDPATRGDRADLEAWVGRPKWLGLEVIATFAGGEDDDEGEVEFSARYRLDGALAVLRERSTFRRADGRWVYVAGEVATAAEPARQAPKVGRNAPCPCGSGKKYKRCCGAAGRPGPAE